MSRLAHHTVLLHHSTRHGAAGLDIATRAAYSHSDTGGGCVCPVQSYSVAVLTLGSAIHSSTLLASET